MCFLESSDGGGQRAQPTAPRRLYIIRAGYMCNGVLPYYIDTEMFTSYSIEPNEACTNTDLGDRSPGSLGISAR